MKKYKLLYFVSEDEYFLTHKLPHALIALKNGFEVMIVCKFSKFKKKILSYGFKVQNLKLDRKNLNPFKEINNLIILKKIIGNFEPDIIVNVSLKPILYGSICSFFSKTIRLKINAIVGLGYLFINNNIKAIILRGILKKLLYFLLSDTRTFCVFQNNDDLKYFVKNKILKSSQNLVIKSSGVDTKYFKPSNKVKKKYDLIMHSRMLVDKGVLDLIMAIKYLKKKNIFLNVLLLGNPDEKNLATINKSELERWNKENLITWFPAQLNVKKFILQSRIAVLPSYREGFPKSLLEAASCGLPIITNDVEGCREICIDNFNGSLAKARDFLDLSEKIKNLTSKKELIKRMGSNSRKLVLKYYTQEKVSRQFLTLYKKVKVKI